MLVDALGSKVDTAFHGDMSITHLVQFIGRNVHKSIYKMSSMRYILRHEALDKHTPILPLLAEYRYPTLPHSAHMGTEIGFARNNRILHLDLLFLGVFAHIACPAVY